MRKIRKQAAAVGSFPSEEFVGKTGGVVPIDLLGDEIIDTGALVNLRELPAIAKRVGVPSDLTSTPNFCWK